MHWPGISCDPYLIKALGKLHQYQYYSKNLQKLQRSTQEEVSQFLREERCIWHVWEENSHLGKKDK